MKLISWNEIHDEIRAYVARVRCSKYEKRNTRSANIVRFLYILVALSTSSRFRIPIFYASSTRTNIYHNHLRLSICHVQITLIFQQCPADTFLFFIKNFSISPYAEFCTVNDWNYNVRIPFDLYTRIPRRGSNFSQTFYFSFKTFLSQFPAPN